MKVYDIIVVRQPADDFVASVIHRYLVVAAFHVLMWRRPTRRYGFSHPGWLMGHAIYKIVDHAVPLVGFSQGVAFEEFIRLDRGMDVPRVQITRKHSGRVDSTGEHARGEFTEAILKRFAGQCMAGDKFQVSLE